MSRIAGVVLAGLMVVTANGATGAENGATPAKARDAERATISLDGQWQTAEGSMEKAFDSPPTSAQCFTHWYWQIPASRENITEDLEAMSRQGIKGVRLYAFGEYMKPNWIPLFKHVLEEAERLDLRVHLNNDRDWSCLGLPWMTPELAAKQYVYSEHNFRGGRRINEPLPTKTNEFYRDIAVLACRVEEKTKPLNPGALKVLQCKTGWYNDRESWEGYPAGGLDFFYDPSLLPDDKPVLRQDVFDISSRMDADGNLDWEAPEGDWNIYRFGYTVFAQDRPDPFSRESLDLHLKESVEKLIPLAGRHVGKTWTHMQLDSWENSCSTWTPKFLGEFRGRRGYEMIPWMPVLAGRVVGSKALSDRFLHDYRRTISDLMVENFFSHWTNRLHEMGLKFTTQGAYGYRPAIVDGLAAFGAADIPQCEFWHLQRHPVTGEFSERLLQYFSASARNAPNAETFHPLHCLHANSSMRLAASAVHTYGKPYCSAESFTTHMFDAYKQSNSPFSIKATGDRAFCEGLQHIAFHVYTLQPPKKDGSIYVWLDVGLHFNRNITWWSQSHAFTDYLSRCAAIFQQGKFVADFAYYTGDVMPYECTDRVDMRPSLPRGCNADLVNTDVLVNRLSVKDGRLLLPDGISYRYLVMPPTQKTIEPASLRRIRELIDAGATVVLGPRPVSAIGLANYPACDREIEALADEIWGKEELPGSGERSLGRGRVVWGRDLAGLLKADGISQDIEITPGGVPGTFDWIHYKVGERDVYFISNQSDDEKKVDVGFRVSGMSPELWDPVWGTRRVLPEFSAGKDITAVPLQFAARQSCFIVFTPAKTTPQKNSRTRNFPTTKELMDLDGSWEVTFDPRWGGPGKVVFDKLKDWTQRPEEGIRYYSGTATYYKTFDLSKGLASKRSISSLFLDLGEVKDLAEVRLNGVNLGVVWTAPWRVDIGSVVKERNNILEIDVVNQWPNRLIGDSRLQEDKRLVRSNYKMMPDNPLVPSGLIGPVTLKVTEIGEISK